ncbi:hypothetical protein AA313_de0201374 [Arthrobotrys entomopaga]|nr:hypothetical protein AA313_de0201374 [Arthrobotrys entomopaga]
MEVLPYDNKSTMPTQNSSLSSRPDIHVTQAPPTQHINVPRVPAGSSGPHIETFIGGAYPVIPRFTPPISGPNDEVVKEPRRFKCSREQTLALERLYQQCPKPNQATKRDLAHAINLSPTRVNIWFQNRRHRAKKHKEIQEQKMAQILETAGRERMAKIALGAPMALSESSLSDLETPTSATSTHSGLPLLTTEFNPSSSEASSPGYTSTKEAAAASLARSLAIASAYAPSYSPHGEAMVSEYHAPPGPFDGPPPANYSLDPYDPNFYPVSTFSDWGSNYTSSVAYTPTPAGQQEDPFEFDKLSSLNSPYHNAPISSIPPVFHDDYSAFAAAVQMNSMPKAMNMNLKSKAPVPNGLVLKNNGSDEQRPMLPRVATCPDLSNIENMSMHQSHRPMPTHTASEASSPTVDSGPRFPATSMERSQSCTDRPSLQQEIALRRLRPMPPSLVPDARAQRMMHGRVSIPQSPLRPGHGTPLPTPPSDADFTSAATKHKLDRKPSDLRKEHSPDVPDLESDCGYEDGHSKQNMASPPPTPETAGLAQAAGSFKEDSADHQYASFTKMLEQSSPIVAAAGLIEHSSYHPPSVENWIHGNQQHYWAPDHQGHQQADNRQTNYEQSRLAYGMPGGQQQN